jgi:hypothetical protein
LGTFSLGQHQHQHPPTFRPHYRPSHGRHALPSMARGCCCSLGVCSSTQWVHRLGLWVAGRPVGLLLVTTARRCFPAFARRTSPWVTTSPLVGDWLTEQLKSQGGHTSQLAATEKQLDILRCNRITFPADAPPNRAEASKMIDDIFSSQIRPKTSIREAEAAHPQPQPLLPTRGVGHTDSNYSIFN